MMSTGSVNEHSVRSARRGAKFLAPLTVLTTLIFLFLVMGVDVFTLKAVAEEPGSVWWYLFWGAAIGLFLFSLSGAIGLVFSLFSAAIATLVDRNKKKAYIVMVGVLLTGVASFLIRSAKSEDLRALEARAVAFHDPVFQEKVKSKEQLQKEINRINNDKRLDNDDKIPPLQDKVNAIDIELASLSDKYSNEARLADAAMWLILLSCIVSIIIDFAYTYCVQKGWGQGHYAEVIIKREKYEYEPEPSTNRKPKEMPQKKEPIPVTAQKQGGNGINQEKPSSSPRQNREINQTQSSFRINPGFRSEEKKLSLNELKKRAKEERKRRLKLFVSEHPKATYKQKMRAIGVDSVNTVKTYEKELGIR